MVHGVIDTQNVVNKLNIYKEVEVGAWDRERYRKPNLFETVKRKSERTKVLYFCTQNSEQSDFMAKIAFYGFCTLLAHSISKHK